MSRFARSGEAGVIQPRSGSAPESPRRRPGFARLVGAVCMLLLTGLLFWLLTDDAFSVDEADVTFARLRHADEAAVRDKLTGLDRAPNVFRIRAGDIVGEVSSLTEVDAATAVVTLPGAVSVQLDEREPLFVWTDRERAWLVDEHGMLFAPVSRGQDPPDGGELAAPRSDLPHIEDDRIPAEQPTAGAFLAPVDLEIMRHLLALTPVLLGSESEALTLRVDEGLGYILRSDLGWTAVFGRYTPVLQPTSVISAQVQCLSALLAERETKLEQVWLVPTVDSCGTFSRHE